MMPSQNGPEAALLFLATMELQRYYGNVHDPVFPYALSADSKYPDIQAGIEKTFTASLAVLAAGLALTGCGGGGALP